MGSASATSATTFKQVNQGGKAVGKETFGVRPLLGIAMLVAAFPADLRAQQNPVQQVAAPVIDDDDIGGVVTSRFGPEAGVWVIAETTGLGTRFAKMAVTDERGRYVIPDLPKANYRVWVRGYGLVDSPKVAAQPGSHLDMTAVTAPSLAEAAQYYPAAYWYSMVKIPDQSRFPGTGDKGNGIPEAFKTQDQWLNFIKTNGCGNCHQIGNYATRYLSPKLGHFESSEDTWSYRLSVGPAGHDMVNFITQLMTPDGGQLKALADWTDRIQGGELPSRSPQRPVGVERNLVVTVRDWLDAKHYLHDLTTTDRRHPTINAYGPIYGDTELSSNAQPVLDPVHNIKTTILPPFRPNTPSSALANQVVNPSPYWGMEQTWDSKVNAHTSTMDQDGRVYWAAQNRSPKDIPAYCKKGSPLRSAQLYPLDVPQEGFFQNSRQVTVYDPKTQKFTMIDTCFGTHHLNFAEDADNTLWLSNNTGLGGAPVTELAVAGWINTRLFWQTGDAAKAQGWTPFIVDTNGNGKRDECYNQPGEPPDYSKDTRIPFGMYAMAYSPADKTVWGSSLAHPGYIMRLDPGANPPNTALTKSTRCRSPAMASAAWMSTAMVSIGCRSTAAISPASTAANARGRSTGRAPRRARNARKALPSTRCRDPASRAIPAPRKTRITSGWTGSISWGSAPMCRSRPATNRIRCTRWSPGKSSSCVSLIRWVFSPRVSKAALTTRRPAGRVANYG